jgi:hypothetical protein
MNINIFDKIFQIMNEYDNLMNNIKKEQYDTSNDIFFKSLFNMITIKKKDNIKSKYISQNTNQDFSQNTNQDFSQNTNQYLSQNTNQYLSQNTNQDLSQNTNQDLSQNTNQYINKDIHKDTNQNTNQDLSQDLSQYISQDLSQDPNNNIENKKNIINNFIKKIYKKIILKCHPDKDGGNTSIFLKCNEYYNNNFLIGILFIAHKLKYKIPPLNNIIIDQILIEIRITHEKIIELKKNMC